MYKEQFQIEVAQFLFDKLKERGSWFSFGGLRQEAAKKFLADKTHINSVVLNGYIRRAAELLHNLDLINESNNHITLKPEAFMMPDSTKIKDLLAQKKKKEQFDDNYNKKILYVNIAGVVVPSLVSLWAFVSKQGTIGQIFGWLLVGFAIGYFVNEIVNKRF
jgi:thiosulfate reductase cytochrome b subunit